MPVAPRVLTEAEKAEVETLAAVLSTEQIADFFGIHRNTFTAIMRRDPDVAVRYKKGRARAIGAVAQGLITKARAGDTTSMIFFLKTQAGWRETTRIEAAAVPEEGTRTIDYAKLSTGALLELRAAMRTEDEEPEPRQELRAIPGPTG